MPNKNEVNVFFASDSRYLPYLAVAVASLAEHTSDNYIYNIRILTTGFSEQAQEKLADSTKRNNIRISVHDIRDKIEHIKEELSLRLRDYYSESIYYRMFIPSMFPELSRAVYVDSDVIFNDDIAKLYCTDIGTDLLGAVSDESVISEPVFANYVKRHIGLVSEYEYFNSGVLLMNLDGLRAAKIEEKFLHILCKYNFNTIAPDQDYLNFLCRGRVRYLDTGWNKHAIDGRVIPMDQLHIMHFNMFNKPWHYKNVQNEELFWHYAKQTRFYAELLGGMEAYTDAERESDAEGAGKLLSAAREIFERGESIADIIIGGYFEMIGLREDT